MRRQKPRNIARVCRCGCTESAHNKQGPYDVSFRSGRSVKGYKLHCRSCKTECGLDVRVLS